MSETEKLLRELIALPSVNPAFLPAATPRAGERRVAEFLAATASRAGLDVEFLAALPGRANMLARLEPRGKVRRRVVLAPHLDTVNGTESQFTPRKKHGRLFGRGACDDKGSVAAMMTALCRMAKHGPRLTDIEILFAGMVDEENGQAGSRALAATGLKADLAIIGEPTRLKVVTAHKGSMWLKLETRGKSAHGSQPELGRNAVHAMARVVDLLETDYAAQLRRRRHPLLGCATISVGAISGGTQANIVPDRCMAMVDRRTLPGETLAGVRREILSFMRKRRLEVSLADGKLAACPPLETDPKLPVIAQWLRQTGQGRPGAVQYFCDAAVLAGSGIPSVVFGPGNVAQAHTADEWISIAELERGKEMLLAFLKFFS